LTKAKYLFIYSKLKIRYKLEIKLRTRLYALAYSAGIQFSNYHKIEEHVFITERHTQKQGDRLAEYKWTAILVSGKDLGANRRGNNKP